MLKCKLRHCFFSTDLKDKLIQHVILKHSYETHLNIPCSYENCSRQFTKLNDFFHHLNSSSHNSFDYSSINCNMCIQVFNSIDSLRRHYYTHIVSDKINKPLVCLIRGCNTQVYNKLTYQKHWSQLHRFASVRCLRDEFLLKSMIGKSILSQKQESIESIVEPMLTSTSFERGFSRDDMRTFYMINFIKFKDKLLVPSTTCVKFFETFENFMMLNNKDFLNRMNIHQNTYQFDKNFELYMKDYVENSLFKQVQEEFSSAHNRQKWIQKSKFYVAPIQISLEENVEGRKSYFYKCIFIKKLNLIPN